MPRQSIQADLKNLWPGCQHYILGQTGNATTIFGESFDCAVPPGSIASRKRSGGKEGHFADGATNPVFQTVKSLLFEDQNIS